MIMKRESSWVNEDWWMNGGYRDEEDDGLNNSQQGHLLIEQKVVKAWRITKKEGNENSLVEISETK